LIPVGPISHAMKAFGEAAMVPRSLKPPKQTKQTKQKKQSKQPYL
jgi:hypothetical protein